MKTTFISKIDGKERKHGSNTVRALKKLYSTDDVEYIYKMEFGVAGVCLCCGKPTDFISLEKGYKPYCTSCCASHKDKYIDGYSEYVKEHFEEKYRAIWNSTNCIDPFDGVVYKSNSVPFSSYVLKYKSKEPANSDFWLVEKSCGVCGEIFAVSIFDYNNRCCCSRHKASENQCKHHLLVKGKEFEFTSYELKQFVSKIDLNAFYQFITQNEETIRSYKRSSTTLLKLIKDAIEKEDYKKNVFLDKFFFTHRSNNKTDCYVEYNGLPIRVYHSKNKNEWKYAEYWKGLFSRQEELRCAWCDSVVSDVTRTKIFDIDGRIVFADEFPICSSKCKSELYKLHNNQTMKFSDELLQMRESQSHHIKKKIKAGVFTPNIVNSFTRKAFSSVEYPDLKFRSSWEVVFWFLNRERIPYSNYERLRVPYIGSDGKEHNYLVDFLCECDKVVYEVKPKTLKDTRDNKLKRHAIESWCLQNGYEYVTIDEQYLIDLYNKGETFLFLDEERRKKLIKDIQRWKK